MKDIRRDVLRQCRSANVECLLELVIHYRHIHIVQEERQVKFSKTKCLRRALWLYHAGGVIIIKLDFVSGLVAACSGRYE